MNDIERYAIESLARLYESEAKRHRRDAQEWGKSEDEGAPFERGHAEGMACALTGVVNELRRLAALES